MKGSEIRKHRERLRMSKASLAREIGVSVDSIRRWEQGKYPPTEAQLLALCVAFELVEVVGPHGERGRIESISGRRAEVQWDPTSGYAESVVGYLY